ncbi:MAG TPA: oxygenase MpaB family protein [Vicinamibacterales bacterium]|nr:oxygenase MpaB family protein [Vicinamibacterales bacterium]
MHDARAFPVARKINREAVVLLGWGRAILMQLAHPLVAAGVGDYSGFRSGARGYVRRVRGTVGGMLDLTFGTADEAQRIVDRINGIHDHVKGTLSGPVGIFPAGTPYSARDPRLLLWVHATLMDSMTIAYETFVGPLTAAEKDAYTLEAAWLPAALGVPEADVPRRFADAMAFMTELTARGEIVVGDEARKLSAALLSPPLGPAGAPLFRLSRTITIGLLPDAVRAGYGFAWGPRESRNFKRAVTLMRRTRRILPRMLREWPSARAVKGH